mmetsp:Transcript_6825/g.15296  ORF Transcript_6825/g.15296 Transcript_6825/m.15296 type:complete len:166 (-) Transcript_6825:354-851(-)
MDKLVSKFKALLANRAPPQWAVYIVALVLFISGCGTFYFWFGLYIGKDFCVDCVPFGLSTFRFLHWPMSDFVLDVLCFVTCFSLVCKGRFVYLFGVTLGFLFIFMAFLAFFMDFKNGNQTQPLFLNVWFIGWGTFMLWFMHHWRGHWSTSKSNEPYLPLKRSGAI